MLKKEDIEHLGVLARISVSPEEAENLAKDLDSVLAYVSEISTIVTDNDTIPRAGELRNVMREDVEPYIGGEFSDAIIKNAPHSEKGYFKVGQIQT